MKQSELAAREQVVTETIGPSTLQTGHILTRARDRSRWEVVSIYPCDGALRVELVRRGGRYRGQRRRTHIGLERLAPWLGGVKAFAAVLLDVSPPCVSYRSEHCWSMTSGVEKCTVCGVVAELRGTDQERFTVQP